MPRRRNPATRTVATVSALGLAVGLAAGLPAGSASAGADPTGALGHALPAQQSGATADPGVVAHLPHDLSFQLAPKLAALYGQSTMTAAEAKALLSQRGNTAARPGLIPAPTPEIGTKRLWPAMDITGNTATSLPVVGLYLKEYTLLGKRDNIEVWVVSGTDQISTGTKFPEGDCRAAVPNTTLVTQQQAQALADEFQDKILPIESREFSVAPAADGTASVGQLGLLGLDFRGDGDSTVTLVDNVRDPNFYDFVNNRTYIAGFFAPVFNVITNRNVMTIDAFDWEHRTGANPKNEPDPDICLSRPARPQLYEGVFAHEYQHLLMNYTDPAEDIMINEGLSDMAAMFVGYADPKRLIHQTRAESHIFCFQGYGEVKGPSNPNPQACGGPANSLTLWEDQGGNSDVLADYGNAWSFLIYLNDRYGQKFISGLHSDGELQGLASVQAALDKVASGVKVIDVIHDFQLMNLLDNTLSKRGAKVSGKPASALTTPGLRAKLNLETPFAYEAAGAAPNGADYVMLRDGSQKALTGKALRSLSLVGATEFAAGSESVPVQNWHLRLVGIDGKRVLVQTFDNASDLTLTPAQLKEFAGYKTVVAVVSVDDLAGALPAYVPYTLTVNGTEQAGGS